MLIFIMWTAYIAKNMESSNPSQIDYDIHSSILDQPNKNSGGKK